MRDNIISYPVEDYNAGACEGTENPESDHPKRKSRKTLRKDDAGIEEARILTWRDDFEIYKTSYARPIRRSYRMTLGFRRNNVSTRISTLPSRSKRLA